MTKRDDYDFNTIFGTFQFKMYLLFVLLLQSDLNLILLSRVSLTTLKLPGHETDILMICLLFS